MNDFTIQMQKTMNEGLTRVDESNRFLREQNTRQSEQNAEILQAVIKRNDTSDERQFQMKIIDKQNFWKAVFAIGGVAGTIIAASLKLLGV